MGEATGPALMDGNKKETVANGQKQQLGLLGYFYYYVGYYIYGVPTLFLFFLLFISF